MSPSNRHRGDPAVPPWWNRHLVEWSLVALVLVALVWIFERKVRLVQAQSERVAVRSTLASLRAALVIDQLLQQARPRRDADAAKTKNPFSLIQEGSARFAGEVAMQNIHSVPPGSWVFDADCACVGYRLLYPQWLEPAQEGDAIWFRISSTADQVRLVVQTDYRWLDQPLN